MGSHFFMSATFAGETVVAVERHATEREAVLFIIIMVFGGMNCWRIYVWCEVCEGWGRMREIEDIRCERGRGAEGATVRVHGRMGGQVSSCSTVAAVVHVFSSICEDCQGAL